MATRFYAKWSGGPVSVTFDAGWDLTDRANLGQLTIDTPALTGSSYVNDTDTVNGPGAYCLQQLISEPLDAISATFPVSKGAFQAKESNAKLNGYTRIVFRKCDEDGSNPVTIGTITDDVEWNSVTTNRFVGASNLTDQALSQGDRLVVEIGFYSDTTKNTGYEGEILVFDGSDTDLPEDNTTTAAYNSWIETGDTFTVASGDPPWEVVKLGPMFAFA